MTAGVAVVRSLRQWDLQKLYELPFLLFVLVRNESAVRTWVFVPQKRQGR